MKRWLLVAGAVVALTLAGCDSKPSAKPTSAPSSSANAPVPGGAAAVAPPGSPALCTELANAPSFRGLRAAFDGLAVDAHSAASLSQIRDASAQLRNLATHTDALSEALNKVAVALDAIAEGGLTASTSDQFAASLAGLAGEVQSICHFPLGA